MRFLLFALISAILFGAAAPAGKVLISSIGPIQLAGLLYLGAAMGVAPLAFRKKAAAPGRAVDRTNLFRLGGAIFFGGILAPVFLLMGLKAASAGSVSLWLPLEMAATAVLGVMIFKDHLGLLGWLGTAGVIGASLLLGLGDKSAGPGAGIWVLAACICWGLDNNLTSLIDSISPARSTFWKGLIAGLINLGLGTAVGNQIGTLTAVGLALLVGALAYGASIALYISAAQNIGASRAQMFFASSPFFGVALAAVALGESVSLVQAAAGAIIAVSLILVFSDKHEHDHSHVESDHEHSHSHDDSHHSHDHAGEEKSGVHSHPHRHDAIRHSHAHWPDLHHRHPHDDKR